MDIMQLFQLASALQLIFKSGLEYKPDYFCELNEAQYEAYHRKMEKPNGKIYNLLPFEPTVIERTEEKITTELTIVTESEREQLLNAVGFVYRASREMPKQETATFEQRLAYLRPRLPDVITEVQDDR